LQSRQGNIEISSWKPVGASREPWARVFTSMIPRSRPAACPAIFLSAKINGNLLAGDGIDADLPREEQEILIPEQEIEDVGIFQKESPFLWNLNGVGC